MASNWFSERQPQGGVTNGAQQQQPNPRLSRIYGDQAVHFNENGRLIYPGQAAGDRDRPTNMLFWRQGAAPLANENGGVVPANNFRYRPWSRTVLAGPTGNQAVAPIITRRVDRFGAPNARYSGDDVLYDTGRPAALPLIGPAPTGGATASKTIKTTMTPETIIVEEMRIYDKKPCGWWLFLVAGLLLLAIGVANGILCCQYHSYSFIWSGIFVIIFALVCVIHRGDYFEHKWKSWLVIIVGFVATAMVSACAYLLLVDYCHQVRELAQFTSDLSLGYYVNVTKYRYAYYNKNPLVTINHDLKYNIWTCFSLDTVVVVVVFVAFGVLTTTLYVVDRFYNSHYVISKKVEPFCHPWLFNPWSQCSLGEAMIVVGCVVGSSDHGQGNTYSSWFFKYAPVWAGIVPVFAGILAALALKNCGIRQRKLLLVAAIAELLSLITSILAIVFSILLLADSIITLHKQTGISMVITSWSQRSIVASTVLYSISAAVCLINVFYSVIHFLRLLVCLLSKNHTEQVDNGQFVLGDTPENAESVPIKQAPAAQTVLTQVQPQQPKVVAPADMPVFQPYRPMGTRSYWIR